jgi:hypothetical protein
MNAKLDKRVELKPIINNRIVDDNAILCENGYSIALFHIDFLWDKHNHEIHDRLSKGETVTVDMKLIEVNL